MDSLVVLGTSVWGCRVAVYKHAGESNERSRVQEIKTKDKRDRFGALDPIWINGILFGCQGHQFGPITAARATAKRCPTAAWKRNCDAIKYCSSTNLDADSFCTDLQRGRKGRTVNDAKEPISISTLTKRLLRFDRSPPTSSLVAFFTGLVLPASLAASPLDVS